MSIKIGDENNIKNTIIIDGKDNNVSVDANNRNWIKKHPIISSFLISLLSGAVLLFSFWQDAISFIENLFR